MGSPPFENRLAQETSPYLLQHAHNPVDWYPWGPEALERARREDKPILLSVGYAACHWCHVMERECFEDVGIAALMNASFVCVKVDREERPDIDDIYMAATLALNGHGGWPMTVFLTPQQEPFFAGTYFPPESRGGLIGFRTLLGRIHELWRNERSKLASQAAQLTGHLRAHANAGAPSKIAPEVVDAAMEELAESFDATFGGFGAAPKFPPCAALSLLLRVHRRTGERALLEMVEKTLDGMKNGGIYDQLGGGFARYSTDERWLVPHFEKMLYDNAQLASVYLEAYQVTGSSEYQRIARETLDYIIREMQAPDGGYYSSTDADSEGEEGKFFVFTPAEIHSLLEPRIAHLFCSYYDITPMGNWEGRSILNTPRPFEAIAGAAGMAVADARGLLEVARKRMYEARRTRVAPLLDDKILTSWNGLMIGAMAEGARVLGDERYYHSAERAARFVLSTLRRPDGGLYRTARGGRAQLDGYLEDYAFLADGLISLYEASGRAETDADPTEWLFAARILIERLTLDFGSDDGSFHSTAHAHEALLLRPKEGHDGALPSANAVAARALARLGSHFGRSDWLELAEAALEAYGQSAARAPRAFATTLSVLERLREPPLEVVTVGRAGSTDLRTLLGEIAKVYLPNATWAHAGAEQTQNGEALPLTRDKPFVDGSATLYVCRNFSCQGPIIDVSMARAELARASAESLSHEFAGAMGAHAGP